MTLLDELLEANAHYREGFEVGETTGDQRKVQLGEIGARPLDTPFGIDRDDAAAGSEDAEQESDLGGPVAQQHADARARVGDVRGDGVDGRAKGSPRAPQSLELDRGRRGIDRDDVRDALAQCGH